MLEKIGKNLHKIFFIIVGILIFIFGYQCGGDTNSSKTQLEAHTDTFRVVTSYTVYPKDTTLKFNLNKSKPKIDTVVKIVYLDSSQCNRVLVYEDSIITKDYNVYSKKHIQGLLRFDTIGVKLKVPLRIIDSVKTTIRDSIFLTKSPKYQLQVGLLASPKMLTPTVDLSINRSTYSIGYDPFNKQPIIGYKFRLIGWTPKKRK